MVSNHSKRGGRKPGTPKTGGRKPGSLNKATRAVKARILRDEALTVESTVEAIRRGQNYDLRRLFDDDGNIRPLHTLSEEDAWCIGGYEIIKKNAEAGDGHIDTVHKIKLIDRRGYVELAAKHQGMLVEKVDVNLKVEDIVETLRQRLRRRRDASPS